MKLATLCHLQALTIFLFIQPLYSFNLQEVATFAKGFIEKPFNVDSPLPCSSSVGYELIAPAIARQKKDPHSPLKILEVGAGTGSITHVLAKILRPGDLLDVIEISDTYCSILQKKFGSHHAISIHCTPFLEWAPDYTYDFIVSTLPLNSFDYPVLNRTIEHFKELIKQHGILSYVAIAGITQAKSLLLKGNAKKAHSQNITLLNNFRSKYQVTATTVMASAPPIRVYHLQIGQ